MMENPDFFPVTLADNWENQAGFPVKLSKK